MMPTSKLNVDVFANYSGNLNAQIISGIIGGPQTNGTTAQAATVSRTCYPSTLIMRTPVIRLPSTDPYG